MSTRSVRLATAYFQRAIACLIACACAGETRERPPSSAPRVTEPATPRPPLPLPPTAFQSDRPEAARSSPSAASPTAPTFSRFETRHIGGDGDGRPRYRGARIDLDLKNAELSEVFRLIADVGHVSIVVAGEVTGTITLRLKQVPWDQALDVIARTKGLGVERDGSVIIVHPAGK